MIDGRFIYRAGERRGEKRRKVLAACVACSGWLAVRVLLCTAYRI